MGDLSRNGCGCGCDNGCGNGLFGGSSCCSLIWIILLLSCCCGNGSGFLRKQWLRMRQRMRRQRQLSVDHPASALLRKRVWRKLLRMQFLRMLKYHPGRPYRAARYEKPVPETA